jgi:hypothetical protein
MRRLAGLIALSPIQRSANFSNSFVAIFIQVLKSLLLRPKLNRVSCGLYSIKGDKLVNGPRQLRGHRFEIVTVHFTNSRALSLALVFSLTVAF